MIKSQINNELIINKLSIQSDILLPTPQTKKLESDMTTNSSFKAAINRDKSKLTI